MSCTVATLPPPPFPFFSFETNNPKLLTSSYEKDRHHLVRTVTYTEWKGKSVEFIEVVDITMTSSFLGNLEVA